MINLDKKLINEELERDRNEGFKFSQFKLSNRFLDRLFNHYYVHEICENFYDSEPHFDDEEYNMYLDYRDSFEVTGLSFWNVAINLEEIEEKQDEFRFCKEPHTKEELKIAYDKVVQTYKDYEPKRMRFCNWQEIYGEGIWMQSQEQTDKTGREFLEKIKKFPYSLKDRLYIARKDDQIRIYFYGRDLWQCDYWFIFMKRKRRLK